MGWLSSLTSGAERLLTKFASGEAKAAAKAGVKAEGKAATKSYVRRGAAVVARNPVKTAVAGVGVGSLLTGTDFTSNLWSAVSAPMDLITQGGFSNLWNEIEEPFMMGVLVGGGMVLLKMDNGLMCIAAPAALELLLENHNFGSSQLDPFHLVLNVAPAAAGGYIGCQVLGLVI